MLGSDCENRTEGGELRDGCKCFIVVDALDLREALSNDACLVFLDGAIRSAFYAEDPLTPDDFAVDWAGNDLVNAQVLEHTFFIVACELPLSGIWVRHGFRV